MVSDASAPDPLPRPCVRQHCPSDRCEPYRVQPQLLWEVVKQVGETVPLEQQHVCIAPVSVGFLAFEPLDGEVLRVRRFGFVLHDVPYHVHQPDDATDVFALAQNLFQLVHAIKGIVYMSSDFARMGWKARP